MKSFVTGVLAVALSGLASVAWADRVVMKSGSSYDVRGFEIGTTAVKMVTPEGKAWSVLKDAVDVGATLKANGMMAGETRSPGWNDASANTTSPIAEDSKKESSAAKVIEKEKKAEEKQQKKEQEKLAKEEAKRQKAEVKEEEKRQKAEAKEEEKRQKEEAKREKNEGKEEKREPEPEYRESRAIGAELQTKAPAPKRTASPPAEQELTKYVVLFNGGYNGSALNFSSSRTFTLNLENGSLQGSYAGDTGLVLEFGGLYRFRGPWGAGATVELFGGDNDVTFSESLPHPFFFNQPRTLQGTVPGLTYRETAVNVNVAYSRVIRPQIVVDGFGGPTFFLTKTQILSDIQYTDVYPYDSVTLQAPVVAQQTDAPVGFNVGGGVTYRLNRWLGAGFSVRYNRATVTVTPTVGNPLSFNAGGVHANGGIRFLF